MKHLALALLLLSFAHARPARAAMEVGADAGAFLATDESGRRSPFGLVGATIGWRLSEAHWVGVGGRFVFPNGDLPVVRAQYAVDFEVRGFNVTVPVSFGVSPLRACAVEGCGIVPETRAGVGVQAWSDFLAPWVSMDVAIPLSRHASPMVGVHLSLRWEPTPEAEER